MAPFGKKDHFMSIEEGVRRLREGLFAFHMETGAGYKLIGRLVPRWFDYRNFHCILLTLFTKHTATSKIIIINFIIKNQIFDSCLTNILVSVYLYYTKYNFLFYHRRDLRRRRKMWVKRNSIYTSN